MIQGGFLVERPRRRAPCIRSSQNGLCIAGPATLSGERSAAGLGTDVTRIRWTLYALVSLCTAVLVSVSGIIGFVGLVIPHAVRFFVGPLHARVLPLAILAGALIVVWADIVARTLMPARELPLGLVTSAIGVPAFIWLLRRQKGI